MEAKQKGKPASGEQKKLFEVYWALKQGEILEAQKIHQKIRLGQLGLASKLRYYSLAAEIELKKDRPQEAQKLLLKALQEGKNSPKLKVLLDYIHYQLGFAYNQLGRFIEAYKLHRVLLSKVEEGGLIRIKLFISLGMELLQAGESLRPLDYFKKACNLSHTLNQKTEQALASLGAALCYREFLELDKALIFANQGRELLKGGKEFLLQSRLQQLVSQLLLLKNYPEKAENLAREALDYAKKTGNPEDLVGGYSCLAQAQLEQNDPQSAQRALELAENYSNDKPNQFLMEGYIGYAGILNNQGYYEEAEKAIQKGLKQLEKSASTGKALASNYYHFGKALAKLGNYQGALKLIKRALFLREKNSTQLA